MPDILVLGSTGTTGSRVAALLAEARHPVRLATRTPRTPRQVRFDWADRATHEAALTGVTSIYLIAPIGVVDPAPIVEPFLAEAAGRGVRRVVLLSSSAVSDATPGLGELHRLVRAMPEWTILRPSWFMQNFTGQHAVALGIRAGEIVTATGDGRVAFVDAADIAAVAVRALTDPRPHDTEHVLTGPSALSYAQAAAIITETTGRPVRHRHVEAEELVARLSPYLKDFATILADLDTAIRDGAEDRVTHTVEHVTGRPAGDFRSFVDREIRDAVAG